MSNKNINIQNRNKNHKENKFHNYKFPVSYQGPNASYHMIRHDPKEPGFINKLENEKERENEVKLATALTQREIGERELSDRKEKNALKKQIIDDYIKDNELNRKERTKFLRLYELGIYYVKNGRLQFDNNKYKELLNLYHSNTEFDEMVKRKAHKAYDKYAKKTFGSEFGHDTPAEKRVAKDPNLQNIHDYPKMQYMKKQFEDKYKKKYAKKRMRYIKKQYKKQNLFDKWKKKLGFSL